MKLTSIILLATILAMFSSCDISSVQTKYGYRNSWLPLNREELIAAALNAIETEFPEGLMHSEFRERENPDDTVWFYLEQENFPYSMALVGSGSRIHSLKIFIPVVNLDRADTDKAFRSVSEIFAAIFPDWTNAKEWPKKSLRLAWGDYEIIEEERKHGVTISTFASAPDVIYFVLTVRDRCIPSRHNLERFYRVHPCYNRPDDDNT